MPSTPSTAEPLVITRARQLGYVVFTAPRGGVDVNVIGIRSASRTPGAFDDHMTCSWVVRSPDGGTGWATRTWPITTDPGLYWLQSPSRIEGTAIVAPGQYRGLWKLGLHKGQYEALVQAAPVQVYRDANRDDKLDMSSPTVVGMFGINCHRANATRESTVVDKWSAGCQVFADPRDFAEFMSIVKLSMSSYGSTVTYTLLDEWGEDAQRQ